MPINAKTIKMIPKITMIKLYAVIDLFTILLGRSVFQNFV